jgi:hypothetical protein
MKTTANELRTMVMDNALNLGRLSEKALGKDDYKELTSLYTTALDALTHWASADYAHVSTTAESDAAFTAIKAILSIYATDEDRIIIDQTSMRTMRDLATKPRRQYSAEYKRAHKAYKDAEKTVFERLKDLITLGAPAISADETAQEYTARVRSAGINTVVGECDMLDMLNAAWSVFTVKTKARKKVMDAGNWTWKRPVAVSVGEFAELVENYVADCLMDGYNLKSSKTVRDERAAERAARAEAKKSK